MSKYNTPFVDDDDDEIAPDDFTASDARRFNKDVNIAVSRQGTPVILPIGNEHLGMLISVVKEINGGTRPAFRIAEGDGVKKLAHVYKRVGSLLRMTPTFMDEYAHDLVYAPDIQLFYDVLHRHEFRHCCIYPPGARCPRTGKLVGEVGNEFVEAVRVEAKTPEFRKKNQNWKSGPKENRKSLGPYLSGLFSRYARLAVIRIDLMYKQAAFDDSEIPAIIDAVQLATHGVVSGEGNGKKRLRCRVGIEVVMKDRDRLNVNMRSKRSLFRHKVGHVCRIEWSRIGGYHIHLALFFDGSKVQKHEWLCDQIGQYWVDVITEGRGLYHNCNSKNYREYAIGMIDHHDSDKRRALLKCLDYLAKCDQYVRAKPSERCKMFTKGHVPEPSRKGGRPRTRTASKSDSPGHTGTSDDGAGAARRLTTADAVSTGAKTYRK